MVQCLDLQLRFKISDGSNDTTILDVLPYFQIACITTRIHEGIAMKLFHNFMRNPAGAALNARTGQSSWSCSRQEGKLTSYCKVVKYF